MLTLAQEHALIDAAIARFPATFGLRAFPGLRFRLSFDASYVSEGVVTLYLYVERNGQWLAFTKGTEEELRAQLRPL